MNGKPNTSGHLDDPHLFEAVRGSAEQIWQAGLGVFAKAQHDGEELFAKMVKEGVDVQKRVQDLAGERLSGLSEAVSRMAENFNFQASGSWEKLENAFEERVSRSLRNLGVPTRGDLEAIGTQIVELQKVLAAATAKKSAGKSVGAAATKKPAAKPSKKQAGAKGKSTAAKNATRTASRRAPVSAGTRH